MPANATIKIGEAASVELHARGVKIFLSREGTYSLGPIFATRRAMDASGATVSLKATLVNLVRGPSFRQSTAMGVLGSRGPADDEERAARAARRAEQRGLEEREAQRQAERAETPDGAGQREPGAAAEAAPPPMSGSDQSLPPPGDEPPAQTGAGSMQEPPASAPDDEARSSLSAGKALIVTEQYERAAAMLTDALAAATEDELPEVRYYLAYAQSMTGDTPAALKLTDDLEPAGDEEWAADFVILRAQLLVDASAFSDEVKWLAGHAAGVSTDPDLAPAYYFLLALGHRGMGDISKGKQNLSKVVSLSAKSELGKAAAHLLRME